MESELESKIKKLPMWAQEHLKRRELDAEPHIEEIVRLRREVEKLNDQKRDLQHRIDVMVDIFSCGAKGGSEVARAAVEKVIDLWGLTLDSE